MLVTDVFSWPGCVTEVYRYVCSSDVSHRQAV